MKHSGDSPWVRRLFRLPLTRARVRTDLDVEIAFHIAERVEELVTLGWTREDAEREIHRRFGDIESYRREAHAIDNRMLRRQYRLETLEQVRRELRRAARSLLRQPLYAFVAVVTLALGIGGVAAIFTLIDHIMLRPLPYADADRLVDVRSAVSGKAESGYWGVSVGGYFAYRHRSHSFTDLAAVRLWQPTVMGSDVAAERVSAAFVSASVARVLGMHALVGRLIIDADHHAGLPDVAVLGYGLWRRRYGSDALIVGKPITIEGMHMTVVGVMAPDIELPDQPIDLWLPLPVDSTAPPLNDHRLQVIGRLLPQVTVEEAQRDLAAVTRQFPELLPSAYSGSFMKDYNFRVDVSPMRNRVLGNVGRVLWILFTSMGVVLLVACTNVGNLYLVRLQVREQELAVRASLGASRGQLIWHLLSECLLIGLSAGAVGLVFAWAAVQLLVNIAPFSIPRLADVSVSGRELAFVGLVSLAIGLVFGFAGSLRNAGANLATLRDATRSMLSSRRQSRTRDTLMASQVALALVLLATAGVLLESFRHLRNVRPGFDASNLLTLSVAPPFATYHSYAQVEAYYRHLLERLSGLPGVGQVGVTQSLPLGAHGGADCKLIFIEGRPLARGGQAPCFDVPRVSPSYFAAMRIPVRGAVPTWPEVEQGRAGVLVSESLAHRLWPGEDAVGKALNTEGDHPPYYRVIGVAGDVYAAGLEQPASNVIYFPLVPIPSSSLWSPSEMTVVVRSHSENVVGLAANVRQVVTDFDRDVPVENVQSMRSVVARSMARVTFTMLLLLSAAGLALFLSAIGIYGVIAYVVGQRRGEIGIRLALGGHASQVSRTVMFEGIRVAGIGAAVGMIGAYGGTHLLHVYLSNVSPEDPAILLIAGVVVMLVATLASIIPARRAARISPLEALRG